MISRAAWSLLSEWSQDTVREDRLVKKQALSFARARSMIDGLDPDCDHVCSLTGLRVSSPFSSIHSWKSWAHDEFVEWGRDHRGEWVLKSPKKRVGVWMSSSCEKM